MRTTVEIPDELFRRAKAVAALRGRKFRELVEEGLRRVLEQAEPGQLAGDPGTPTLEELMRESKGIIDSGVPDLASNPKHMEGFGRGSTGDH